MDLAHIRATIEASIATKQRLLAQCSPEIERLVRAAVECIRRGGTIFFCGNGGSSCDASHAVGELVGWFERKQRRPYAAVALGHEVPSLTAISNDAGYEHVFSRQLEALGKRADLLVGISTSGNSKNVVAAVEVAKRIGMATAALTGEKQSKLSALTDVCVRVPSDNTARIQESHLLCIHMLCAGVEDGVPS